MRHHALMIGGFVMGGLLVIVLGIFWLGGADLLNHSKKARVFYQGNVSGLSIGAPVTFRGVVIGQVTDIAIEMDPGSLKTAVPVTLKLQTASLEVMDAKSNTKLDLRALVKRGLRARLTSQSVVTGQKAIELDFLPNTPAVLLGNPHSKIPEIPALRERFGALIDQVADLPLRETVADVRATIKQLQDTLILVQKAIGGANEVVHSAANQLDATGEESRKTLAAATMAIRHVQDRSGVTLDAITRLAESSQQALAQAQPELQRTLVSAREASETAKVAMDRLAEISAPGAPLRGDIEAAVQDIAQASRSLRAFSEGLEERPNSIIFGNRRP